MSHLPHHSAAHSSHVRLTNRGRVAVGIVWFMVAWFLASVIPVLWWR